MDGLVFRCPACQQPFQVLAEQSGETVRCPGCQGPVQIPPPSKTQTLIQAIAGSAPGANLNRADGLDREAGTGQNDPQVQPYDCPLCEQAFGIFASMFDTEVACPHCQRSVLLVDAGKSSKVIADRAQDEVKRGRKRKVKPVVRPTKLKNAKPKKKEKPSKPPTADAGAEAQTQVDHSPQAVVETVSPQTTQSCQKTEVPNSVFQSQSVEHLLPPKFEAVDPAFFYRQHSDGSQVLLPSDDGGVKVVDNRVVRIEHNGRTYDLISSPRYNRIQRSIVSNLLAVIICGLVIAIVMTLLK